MEQDKKQRFKKTRKKEGEVVLTKCALEKRGSRSCDLLHQMNSYRGSSWHDRHSPRSYSYVA